MVFAAGFLTQGYGITTVALSKRIDLALPIMSFMPNGVKTLCTIHNWRVIGTGAACEINVGGIYDFAAHALLKAKIFIRKL